jgi:hypothetical protein
MICPCCKIFYDEEDKVKMFDHIKECKGRKDIITTRWYTYKQLETAMRQPPQKELKIDTEWRPVTR